ncbi:MAG: sulfotransferase [Robiginitomaculum sp.]|nr:sulfotransferase [Robiginitomaculum sp.]
MSDAPLKKDDFAGVIKAAKAAMNNGGFSKAQEKIQTILREEPEHRDGLYILAVCQRYQNEADNARASLEVLTNAYPAYGRAYQELGHIEFAANNHIQAAQAYQKAVSLNPALPGAWRRLVDLGETLNDLKLNQYAHANFNYFNNLPREILSATSAMHERNLAVAEKTCRHYLKHNPKHVEAMRLFAKLGIEHGQLDEAEFVLESAISFEPDHLLARLDYVNILYKRQNYKKSHTEAKLLASKQVENSVFAISYANQCAAIGRFEEALEIFNEQAQKDPSNANLFLSQGHAFKTIGNVDAAVGAYRNAYKARTDLGDAYWSLANLKTYRFVDTEISTMKLAEKHTSTSLDDRAHLCFALGKSYEDEKEFEQAFQYYERGNGLRTQQFPYSADAMSKVMSLQKQIFTKDFIGTKKDFGCDDNSLIFIVGLPRAGSTLLEQILASHSDVDGAMEFHNIATYAQGFNGRLFQGDEPRYPKILQDTPADKILELGKRYLDDTSIHRKTGTYLIDKMPNNFRHIGLINLIFPEAKIIDARRHPMACCFSGFKQLFSSGQEFTYGLENIGRYYRDYVGLMDHWDDVLEGKILRVQYEDVVDDLETQVRRILDFCNLPFEKSCVDFYKTKRDVRTPSSEQVRQPIYRSGLDQWRNFEPWLGPLKKSLGPEILKRYPLDG